MVDLYCGGLQSEVGGNGRVYLRQVITNPFCFFGPNSALSFPLQKMKCTWVAGCLNVCADTHGPCMFKRLPEVLSGLVRSCSGMLPMVPTNLWRKLS